MPESSWLLTMSGFFLAAGVFLWTIYRERSGRWGSWVAGSLMIRLASAKVVRSVSVGAPASARAAPSDVRASRAQIAASRTARRGRVGHLRER